MATTVVTRSLAGPGACPLVSTPSRVGTVAGSGLTGMPPGVAECVDHQRGTDPAQGDGHAAHRPAPQAEVRVPTKDDLHDVALTRGKRHVVDNLGDDVDLSQVAGV